MKHIVLFWTVEHRHVQWEDILQSPLVLISREALDCTAHTFSDNECGIVEAPVA